jgi:hypothetical protein
VSTATGEAVSTATAVESAAVASTVASVLLVHEATAKTTNNAKRTVIFFISVGYF